MLARIAFIDAHSGELLRISNPVKNSAPLHMANVYEYNPGFDATQATVERNIPEVTADGLSTDLVQAFNCVGRNDISYYGYTIPMCAWTNTAVVPFVLAGVGTPLSGTSSGFSAITDAGAYVSFGHFAGGQLNAGACYGRWDNAGDYSGPRYHFFLGWSKGF